MTPSEARTQLETTFQSAWGSTTPIHWGNTTPPTPNTAFVRFTMIHSPARMRSWSGNVINFERPGIVFIQIFTPLGSGTRRASDLAYQALSIMENRKFGALSTGVASVIEVGQTDGGMDQVQVRVEFTYDEQKVQA